MSSIFPAPCSNVYSPYKNHFAKEETTVTSEHKTIDDFSSPDWTPSNINGIQEIVQNNNYQAVYSDDISTQTNPVVKRYEVSDESVTQDSENMDKSVKTETGQVVRFEHVPEKGGLKKNYIENYYAFDVELVSLTDDYGNPTDTVSDKKVVIAETDSVTAWLGQKNSFLPRIWTITPEGERSLLDIETVDWETSNEQVITIEDRVPIIADTGEAVLTGKTDDGVFELNISVKEPDKVDDFTTKSDSSYCLEFQRMMSQVLLKIHIYGQRNCRRTPESHPL